MPCSDMFDWVKSLKLSGNTERKNQKMNNSWKSKAFWIVQTDGDKTFLSFPSTSNINSQDSSYMPMTENKQKIKSKIIYEPQKPMPHA